MEQYTFPNSITINIKYINRYQAALLRAGLDTKYPKPAAPINSTDLGDIPNPDDPAYALALSEWETKQQQRLNLMVLRHCCTPAEDANTVAQRLAELDRNTAAARELMAELGVPEPEQTTYDEHIFSFDPSDAMRYLYLIAASGNPDEITTVLGMIGDTVDRTEEAIKAMEATF